MDFKGVAGSVEVFDDRLVIKRKGVNAFLQHGLKGDKSIPFASITAVQFKRAGFFTNGYIQFSLKGGLESRGGLIASLRDENSVIFRRSNRKAFTELKELVEQRISSASPIQRAISGADELEKFAALRDKGIISTDEFETKKKAILGIAV